ncbi:hypothetical protein WOLCODRAFT_20571 [Wolfiporia cocos MD-104 SS10]|uniref:Uncharacterized protein n=1 Tax=Wolfiporia cocos (strain MD-104) TaxID=742152 RepID=A0A2H3JKG0_WOLCO|nr:hypothetical protein WOLCODRAFT_20571 [Wolfiporia cocos MD-104 SS10]
MSNSSIGPALAGRNGWTGRGASDCHPSCLWDQQIVEGPVASGERRMPAEAPPPDLRTPASVVDSDKSRTLCGPGRGMGGVVLFRSHFHSTRHPRGGRVCGPWAYRKKRARGGGAPRLPPIGGALSDRLVCAMGSRERAGGRRRVASRKLKLHEVVRAVRLGMNFGGPSVGTVAA